MIKAFVDITLGSIFMMIGLGMVSIMFYIGYLILLAALSLFN